MKLYGRWTVTIPDDETYTWEPDAVTLGEQLMLETETGMSYDDWIQKGVAQGRAEACQILIWFLRRKRGRQEDRNGVNFPIRHLELEQISEPVDDDPEAPAASEAATSTQPSGPTGSGPGSSGV